jgi:hypothetical protein
MNVLFVTVLGCGNLDMHRFFALAFTVALVNQYVIVVVMVFREDRRAHFIA